MLLTVSARSKAIGSLFCVYAYVYLGSTLNVPCLCAESNINH